MIRVKSSSRRIVERSVRGLVTKSTTSVAIFPSYSGELRALEAVVATLAEAQTHGLVAVTAFGGEVGYTIDLSVSYGVLAPKEEAEEDGALPGLVWYAGFEKSGGHDAFAARDGVGAVETKLPETLEGAWGHFGDEVFEVDAGHEFSLAEVAAS